MKNLFPYLKPYTGKLLLCFIFMLGFAILSSFSLSLLAPFIKAIFYGGETFFSLKNDLLNKFSFWFLKGTRIQAFIKLQIVMVLIFLFKGIFGYIHRYLGASVEERVMKNIRDNTYTHLHFLSLDYFHRSESGVIISRITNDISKVKGAVKDGILAFVKQLLLILAYFCLAFYLSWQLLLVTIITFPVLFWLIGFLGKKLRKRSDVVQENMGKITSTLGETISGIKIVKAFSMERFEIRKFFQSTYNYLKSALRFERIGLLGVPLSELITAVGACILLGYGGYQVFVTHTLSPDRFLIFLACAISMTQPLRQLSQANVWMQQGFQAMVRVKRILDTKPTVKEVENPIPLKNFNKEIVFDNISFSYNHSKEVIQGVTLKIKKGEDVALVGSSGAGKSTLTDLLARFYDPSQGTIKIDGVDIKQVTLKNLRELIGLVTQEPVLFNDTVFNNIAYGISDAKPEDVYEAAKLANAHDFIKEFPQGYNTVVGERGVKLSGGERQRIAIARALYKNPEILIFDEATSHLDPESESKVQEAIERMLRKRTAIVVAHRLSTVKDCDRIIVIDNGQIVEQGTHLELLKNKGLYKKLIDKELS
ncbi:ABC transporter ATP-binding protein [candidate division WOR-3 bacterium]|nr:ABC transporter ATP-binding protein [candidate division WOR-3 bacterium]